MRCLVVVPTFEEADTIAALLRGIRVALPDADVLVVDDASGDATADIADQVGRELGRVQLLRRPGKAGLGDAYRAGFQRGLASGAEILVEIDADLSHDPAVLPALVSAVEHGADLVIGSRYVPGGTIRGWSRGRDWLSRWANRYAALMLGLAVNDATSGYRAYRASALRSVDLDHVRADGYGFQVELTYRLVKGGARVVEIPIDFVDRTHGSSKMSGRIVAEAFLLVTGWGVRDVVAGRRRRVTRSFPRGPARG